MKQQPLLIPNDCTEVLLHACCAPCSSAIVEWLVANGVRPTIFYYNPNIWPREEYEIRKRESQRHAESLGIRWIDGDYDHEAWRQWVFERGERREERGERNDEGGERIGEGYDPALEPERGRRCEACFTLRLTAAARKAQELGIRYFTTTLASSRWKSLEQIERAGRRAEQIVNESTQKEGIARRPEGESPLGSAACLKQEPSHLCSFWAQNWRKGGLQQRRNELLKEYGFYNQQYCGCEFSASRIVEGGEWKEVLRQQMREAKKQHREQLARMSEEIVEKLAKKLSISQCIMAYWPLPDEVDIRPLIDQLVVQGKTVLLPKVVDGETMELRRYTSRDDLREGAFRIMEPVGEPFTDYDAIDVALVPGMAFDAAGHRLGRGKGYYDRFLSEHLAPCPSRLVPRLIGVCFPFQRVAEVPSEEHDVCMDEIT